MSIYQNISGTGLCEFTTMGSSSELQWQAYVSSCVVGLKSTHKVVASFIIFMALLHPSAYLAM